MRTALVTDSAFRTGFAQAILNIYTEVINPAHPAVVASPIPIRSSRGGKVSGHYGYYGHYGLQLDIHTYLSSHPSNPSDFILFIYIISLIPHV